MPKCTTLSMCGKLKRGSGMSSDGMAQRTKIIAVHNRLMPMIRMRLEDMAHSAKIRTFIFTTETEGSTASIAYPTKADSGTDLVALLALNELINGSDQDLLISSIITLFHCGMRATAILLAMCLGIAIMPLFFYRYRFHHL